MSAYPMLMHSAIDATDCRGLAEFYRKFLGLRYRPGDEVPNDENDEGADWLVLLDAVRAQGPRGEHLEAFFGCLYYAALRPRRRCRCGKAIVTCPPAGGEGSTWRPPSRAPDAAGPTAAPPTKPAASSTAPSTRCGRSPSR